MQGAESEARVGSEAQVGAEARVGSEARMGAEARVGSEGRSSYNSSTIWKASSSDQETVNSNASGMQISFLGTASSVDCRSRYPSPPPAPSPCPPRSFYPPLAMIFCPISSG